jgi:hypothetical protein
MPAGTVIIEFWGGLHDGKRQTVRGKASSLPAILTIEEIAPVIITPHKHGEAAPKPQKPGKYVYTYELDTKHGKVFYRYRGYELVKP